MIVELSKYPEGNRLMADVKTPPSSHSATVREPAETRPRISEAQLQAVVQAAYILDAVRR